jgi:ABC-type bacteriocin/lantibiotic exporter with double-glycine peptidase domain
MRMLQIDFGDRLVDGLDTRIGFNGIKLSGGQNQRLMIGAAALKEPRFMIIDEATSSLDATTERLVQDGLARVLHNCGALIVTHRLNTVRRICDRFILLDRDEGSGGTIHAVADSFEALADISPAFRNLAMDQGIELGSTAKSA